MAEIGAGLGSDFPNALDTDNQKEKDYPAVDKTVQRADVPNDLAAAILAIETKVGIDKSSDTNSIDYKLALAGNPGKIEMWGGSISNIPSGYLLCEGSAVSRTTYADLFFAIGTIHGAGDGSTTFNLPDLRDKFLAGAKQDDGGVPKTQIHYDETLKQTGGSKTTASGGGGEVWLGADRDRYSVGYHTHQFAPLFYAMVFIIKI